MGEDESIVVKRICLDVTAATSVPTGIGYYAWHITDRLFQMAKPGRLTALSRGGLREALPPIVDAPTPSSRARELVRTLSRSVPRAAHMARVVRGKISRPSLGDVALFHAFNFVPPSSLRIPWIPVIHDLSHMRFPDMHPVDRVLWLERFHDRFREVPIVQTVSAFSQREIVALLNVPVERIRIVKPSIDRRRFDPLGDHRVETAVLTRFGLRPRGFFLSVCTIEPRKNLRTLVEAYARLPLRLRELFPLVLVGGQGWGRAGWPANLDALERAGHVRFTGYVPGTDLVALYRNAKLFAYPSLYEGFGMPVQEALACGTPVAVSRGTACEEASGGLGALVEATDVTGWTKALADAIDNVIGPERAAALHASIDRDWSDAALEVVGIYGELGFDVLGDEVRP